MSTTNTIIPSNITTTTKPATTLSDYDKLVAEIQSTIDRSDSLFKTIQQSKYPNAGEYKSDLTRYKTSIITGDETNKRNEIWKYLTDKYKENTKLRKFYFSEIRKADEYLDVLGASYKEIQSNIKEKNTESLTAYEKLKQTRYAYNKTLFYSFVYKLLMFVQLCILALAAVSILGYIPFATFLVITVLVLIGTLAYVSYYIFFVNSRRNKHDWNRFEFESNTKSANSMSEELLNQLDRKEKAKIDISLQPIIDESKNASCIA